MSGLLALLDDVAAIAKVAASSVDDVAAAASKAGSKAAGLVIDDAAVTPSYVTGFKPQRELPIIWKITKGSLFNKLIVLLPLALLLSNFAPWIITPLLMLGGCYLCFEGAEKVFHKIAPHADHVIEEDMDVKDPAHLEEAKVRGAIKTDFILSAEIMVLSLAALRESVPDASIWLMASALAVVGIAITVLVYGVVALIVKADDVGLHLAQESRLGSLRALGRAMVKGMPYLLLVLSFVGTLAMLWVGGNIVIHGLHEFGIDWPYGPIKDLAASAAVAFEQAAGFAKWFVTAALDGVFGLVWGMILIPIVTRVMVPVVAKLRGQAPAAH